MPFTNNELEIILYTLEGYLQSTDDDEYADELVRICNKIIKELPPKCESNDKDNVTYNEVDYVEQCITEGHDYRDCVDTLVSNMGVTDDNEEEELPELSIQEQLDYVDSRLTIVHDSEGC